MGLFFVLFFFRLKNGQEQKVSAKTMVNINTVALLSFLVPIYFGLSIQDGSESNFLNYNLLVYQDIGGFDQIVCRLRKYRLMKYMSVIWLVGVLITLCYNLWRYFRFSYIVKNHTFMICNSFWEEIFLEQKEKNKVKNIFFGSCCYIATPCTVGIWKKYILIPSHFVNDLSKEEATFILEHEFYHVVHRDTLRKVLFYLLSCLVWFQPLYYFLRNHLSEWIEIACDEAVTKKCPKEKRRKYCQLIIKILELEENRRAQYIVGFTNPNVQNYQKRMTNIMNGSRTNSGVSKMIVMLFVFSAMFLGTAAAKEADFPINKLFSRNVEIVNRKDITVIDMGEMEREIG